MAQHVELQPRERVVGIDLVVGLLLTEELPAEPLGVDRRAVESGEDPVVVVVAAKIVMIFRPFDPYEQHRSPSRR